MEFQNEEADNTFITGVAGTMVPVKRRIFGYFGELIQRIRGERFVAALSNGACGDINNIDALGGTRSRNDRYQHTERVAARVAAAAFWAWNEMNFTGDAPLGAAMEEVRLQRRPLPTACR